MKKLDKFLISTVLLVNFIYITVRFFSIPIFMGWPSFILGISLFTAEFLGFFAYIIYVFAFTGKRNIPHKIIIHRRFRRQLPFTDSSGEFSLKEGFRINADCGTAFNNLLCRRKIMYRRKRTARRLPCSLLHRTAAPRRTRGTWDCPLNAAPFRA